MIDQVAEVVGDGSATIAVHHVDNRTPPTTSPRR